MFRLLVLIIAPIPVSLKVTTGTISALSFVRSSSKHCGGKHSANIRAMFAHVITS
jgi:hypothetical protein